MAKLINFDRLPSSFLAQKATFPWYTTDALNASSPALEPGSYWWDVAYQNAFMYVQCNAILANGQLVTYATPGTDTVIAAGSTTAVTNLNTGGLTANAESANWVYYDNGGSAPGPTIRKIKANAAGSLTTSQRDLNSTLNQFDADALSAVLTNATNLSIIRRYIVAVCDATHVPVGVALATTTANYYTVIQIAGLGLLSSVGNGNALVVGQAGAPGAAGVFKGPVTPGSPLYMGAGVILPQYAFAGAGPQLTPCQFNLEPNAKAL